MVNQEKNERKETSGLKNKVLAAVVGATLLTGCRGLKYNPNWLNETQLIYSQDNLDSNRDYLVIRTGTLFSN
jgi:hypothetical protein|tara:strand:+ start:591 stop:806 length:216 start_codon:yes stop_codon:yes gene_type:complete